MLENEVVKLRPITKCDLLVLNKWKNDEKIYKFLGGGYSPVSIDQQEEWMSSIITMDSTNKRFIICDLEGAPIGLIGLYNINPLHRSSEIGLFIGESENKSKGIGTNSYRLIENYAKKYLNLRKIKLLVVYENTAAVNFWTKLNFEQIGIYKEERFIDGKFLDVSIMEKFI